MDYIFVMYFVQPYLLPLVSEKKFEGCTQNHMILDETDLSTWSL